MTLIDDFAHHPTAVNLTLHALKQRFGDRRLWAVWEPRSATSRRDTFQEEYAKSFGAADKIIIATPYNQDGIPESERFSADALVRGLTSHALDAITLPSTAQISATLAARVLPGDVVAILSNGGFDGLHQDLLERLNERFNGQP